ncbi:putative sulfatase [Actinobacillus equuli]|nr:putative sulfatase [Actinobacillus equuli]
MAITLCTNATYLLAEMLYSRWCWQKLRSFNRQKWGKYVAYFFLSCFTATHLFTLGRI